MQRLQFALLFDGRGLETWHLRCLEGLEPYADLAGAIPSPAEDGARSLTGATTLLRRYAERLGRREVNVSSDLSLQNLSLDEVLCDGKLALDFVLRLGSVTIPTELAEATRHGVWYFEHERDLDFLPFFREVYDGQDITYTALLRLNQDRHVETLENGRFPTNKLSYEASRQRVEAAIAAWPGRACRNLTRAVLGDESALSTPSAEMRGVQSVHRMSLGQYRARTTSRRLLLARDRLFRHPQWNVGVLPVSAGELVTPGAYVDSHVKWFPLAGREGFLADPFAVVRDGRVHVMCEYYSYRDSKGDLRTLEYSAQGFAGEPVKAMSQPAHMSYPYLLEHDGAIYCIPETAASGEVALYRADEFPLRWSRIATLLSDFPGLDTTVFFHDGRWWLLSTRSGLLEDVELWAWHAAELLGPWHPHLRNPVKTDVTGARPGGRPFVHEGALYRPSQDCSKTYGGRVTLQRVTRLTPREFVEEPVAVLEASRTCPFPVGPHTLTPIGAAVLVDGRRTVFSAHALRAFVKIWASEIGARRGRRRRAS